uniref:Uncharacterized protein n=2 Tax=Oryza sativa subsp. japonica TaxID=39947 RepID=Q2R503_ORYSJ|nr:hypothetical protein [Oryza sativa Japonica Group]AAX96137.1 hypothetical protein LOC_Os11g26700 [Oryza sativa Japonica Group]ABA93485.1 hypothetical protein LOC_Os11g26700 [Oryza sativa Japonica Group]
MDKPTQEQPTGDKGKETQLVMEEDICTQVVVEESSSSSSSEPGSGSYHLPSDPHPSPAKKRKGGSDNEVDSGYVPPELVCKTVHLKGITSEANNTKTQENAYPSAISGRVTSNWWEQYYADITVLPKFPKSARELNDTSIQNIQADMCYFIHRPKPTLPWNAAHAWINSHIRPKCAFGCSCIAVYCGSIHADPRDLQDLESTAILLGFDDLQEKYWRRGMSMLGDMQSTAILKGTKHSRESLALILY